jgi:hypothetical protein
MTDDTLDLALKRYTLVWDFEQQNYEAAGDDLRFAMGEQWPDEVTAERREDNRPMLTINMMEQFISQVVGELRQNRPSIKVFPADTQASKDVAKILTEMIRGIEYESDAQTAYITAADQGVTCGWGAFRINTDYVKGGFEQKIVIERIPDSLSVYFDPDAKELTREDAKWCFYVQGMTWEAFRKAYPDAVCSTWDDMQLTVNSLANWANVDEVKIAEYWVKEPDTKEIALLPDGQTVDVTEQNRAAVDEGVEAGFVKVRKVDTVKVKWYLMTAAEVLKEGVWAGADIPIIPVIGVERNIGIRTVRHGLIRFAKDPQRLLNYHQSTMAEVTALAPKTPFIGTTQQFAGHEDLWQQANRRNLPYLTYTPDPEAPGAPQRSSPSVDISTHMALTELANNNLYGTTGIYPTSLGGRSNESSGVAIAQRQRASNNGTYVYADNLAKAIAYCGRQLVDLIPKIYDTERIVLTVAEDGEENIARINDGVVNLEQGTYSVRVETGPSFTTKRQEAAASMMQFMQAMPQTAAIVADLFAKYQDWPGADRIAERLERALPPGIDPKIDEQRMQEQGPPQPNPMEQLAMQAAQYDAMYKAAKAQREMALAAKDKMEVGQTVADTEKTKAETMGHQLDNAEHAMNLAMQNGQLMQAIQMIVERQISAMLAGRQAPPLG